MKYISYAKTAINKVLDKTIGVFESVVLGIIVISTLSYALAWQAPLGNPPAGNTDAPLNISSNAQVKGGNLVVNALGITASGNALLIPNGNVGIGTTNPQSKLVIIGDAVDTDRILIGSSNPLNLGELRLDFGNLRMIEAPSGLALRSASSGSPHMVILNSGNVGIGTVAPQAKLHVAGTIRLDGGANYIIDLDSTGTGVNEVSTGSAGHLDINLGLGAIWRFQSNGAAWFFNGSTWVQKL